MNKRIGWIDGLRGIACLCIFLHHFFATFYPVSIYGTSMPDCSPMALALVQSPLSVLLNGSFWVCVFCVIAGYVASLPFLEDAKSPDVARLSDLLIKRYFRLSLPVFCISAIVLLLYKRHCFTNIAFAEQFGSSWAALWYREDIYTVTSLLAESFLRLCFVGSDKFIVVLWSIWYLFYGYYVSVILAEMSWGKTKRILCLYIFLILCCLLSGLRLCILSCFPIGTLLAYCSRNTDKEHASPLSRVLACLMVVSGLFLGAFPTYFHPNNYYRFFDFSNLPTESFILCHTIGAFLFISGLCQSSFLRKLLSLRPLTYLGRISFGIYLVHIPVLFTIGTWLPLFLSSHGVGQYHLAAAISFLATAFCVLLFSELFSRFIEAPCTRLVNKAVEVFKK